jgi:hypothetical protein
VRAVRSHATWAQIRRELDQSHRNLYPAPQELSGSAPRSPRASATSSPSSKLRQTVEAKTGRGRVSSNSGNLHELLTLFKYCIENSTPCTACRGHSRRPRPHAVQRLPCLRSRVTAPVLSHITGDALPCRVGWPSWQLSLPKSKIGRIEFSEGDGGAGEVA